MGPCSEQLVVLALPAAEFLNEIKKQNSFSSWFGSLTQPQETYLVAAAAMVVTAQAKLEEKLFENVEYSQQLH